MQSAIMKKNFPLHSRTLDEYSRGKRMKHDDRRDVLNFVQVRAAGPGDDYAVGQFLLRTFLSTYEQKLPDVVTSDERKNDLLDVATKRRSGVVCVLELGYKIVGTFSLIHPDAAMSEAWLPDSGNLRGVAADPECQGLNFSRIMLEESVRIARDWSLRRICLHVQKGAAKVAGIYEKFGYRRDARGDMTSKGQEIEGYCLEFAEIL